MRVGDFLQNLAKLRPRRDVEPAEPGEEDGTEKAR